jgi:hypothetical protein
MRTATIHGYRGRFVLIHELFPFAPSAKIRSVYDLVEMNRKPIDQEPVWGFLLQRSKDLILLHVAAVDVVCLNGYSVFRNGDVRRLKVLPKDELLIRALRFKDIAPSEPPGISLTSWSGLLESVDQKFSLFTIHRERINSGVCNVGRLAAIYASSFALKEIDPKARWTRSRKYKYEDITRLDFGDGYADALASLATTPIVRKRSTEIRGIRSARFRTLKSSKRDGFPS